MALSYDPIERFDLTREQKEEAVRALQHFFREEREEELGNLAAELLLRAMLRDIGPALYNTGVRDAVRTMQVRLEDVAEIELPERV